MDHDQIIADGLKAFASLQRSKKRGFDSWLAVGEGLNAGKNKLMELLQLNSVENTLGRKAYAMWLRHSGYIVVPAEARKALTMILDAENLPRIREWMGTLSEKQKLRWSYPTAIWANWQRHIGSKVFTKPTLVSMTLDSKKEIVKRISPNTHGAEIADYIGLMADIVAFLAVKHETHQEAIVEMVNEAIESRSVEQEAA
jgi:hypothetical protein